MRDLLDAGVAFQLQNCEVGHLREHVLEKVRGFDVVARQVKDPAEMGQPGCAQGKDRPTSDTIMAKAMLYTVGTQGTRVPS